MFNSVSGCGAVTLTSGFKLIQPGYLMYLISDYFSFVAGNAARGTVHKHATFRGSPHIYSRRTITLTATNNQYIVDFDVFMDLLRETKKM